MNPQRITLKVINKKEDFYTLEQDWCMLLQTIQNKSFFHSYGWHKSFVDAISEKSLPMCYLALYTDKNLIGIFPVEMHNKKIFFLKLCILRNTDCFTQDAPIRDFIISDNYFRKNAFEILLGSIRNQTEINADCIILDLFLENSNIFSTANSKPLKYAIFEKSRGCYQYQRTPYDYIYQNYSKNFKKNLKVARKKLSKMGTITFETVMETDLLESALNDFIDLEMSGWKGRKKNNGKGEGQAIGLDKEQVPFFTDLSKNFTDDNQYRINYLKLNNQTISMLIDLKYEKTLYLLKTTYDEDFAKYSPSIILLDFILQSSFESNKNIKYVNFLSDASYLEKFNPDKINGFKLYVFNQNWKGLLYYAGTILHNKLKPKKMRSTENQIPKS